MEINYAYLTSVKYISIIKLHSFADFRESYWHWTGRIQMTAKELLLWVADMAADYELLCIN